MSDASDNAKESDKIDERLASALRRLITRTRDSAASYRKAAEEARDDYLQPEFERMAEERDRLVETLSGVAQDLGVKIAHDAQDAAGDVHRAFLGFKVKLLDGDPRAILAEVARGEAAFERVFDSVLGLGIPKAMRRKLMAQQRAVRQTRDHYKLLARRVRRRGGAISGRIAGQMANRMGRAGSVVRQHPLAAVGVIAASALVLGTVAALSSHDRSGHDRSGHGRSGHDKSRWSLDSGTLRSLEKRLHRLEKRGLRQIEEHRPRDIENRARRGLEKIGRHLGAYR